MHGSSFTLLQIDLFRVSPAVQFYSPEELASAKLQGLTGYSAAAAAVPRTPPSRSGAQRSVPIPGMVRRASNCVTHAHLRDDE